MVTPEHEAPLRFLQHNPKLAEELYCGLLKHRIPAHTSVKPGSEALSRIDKVVKRDCDNIEVYYEGEKPVFALIIEVQRRPSEDKEYVWPEYIITARSMLQCPVALLVICFDKATAAWAREPIEIGPPGFVLMVPVIDPDMIPVVTEVDQVRGCEEIAAMSALAHHSGPQGPEVLKTFAQTFPQLDPIKRIRYFDFVSSALPEAMRKQLEAIMVTEAPYASEFLRNSWAKGLAEGEAKGEARGEAKALLKILEGRGISVDGHSRQRITDCTDGDQIESWLLRSISIDTISELFD